MLGVSGINVGPGSGCDSGDPPLDGSGITGGGGSSNRGGLSQRGAVPSYTSDPYRYNKYRMTQNGLLVIKPIEK